MDTKSIVVWPKEIHLGWHESCENKSDDSHHSVESAVAVCEILQCKGFGCEGKFYPESSRVEVDGEIVWTNEKGYASKPLDNPKNPYVVAIDGSYKFTHDQTLPSGWLMREWDYCEHTNNIPNTTPSWKRKRADSFQSSRNYNMGPDEDTRRKNRKKRKRK